VTCNPEINFVSKAFSVVICQKCTAVLIFGSPCIVPAYVDATELLKHVRVIKNKILVLRCPVQGIPSPNVTWLKDGEPLELEERMRLLMSGRQLEISMSRESDTAWYTCLAENVAGSATIDYNVTVIGISLHHVYLLGSIMVESDERIVGNKSYNGRFSVYTERCKWSRC